MPDAALSLEQFLPYRLNRLADAVSREFARLYREDYGLTRPEWRLLSTLGQFGAMTATAVGRHSTMHKTMVSRAASALEKRRWISRRQDAADRRVEHLQLTTAGAGVYAKLIPKALAFEAQLLSALSPAQRAEVGRALAAIEAAVTRAG